MASKTISVPFTTVDVFTETRYEGNPLAIVLLPPVADLTPSQSQLQAIAFEFNLSETIFLEHATAEDIEKGVRRARIFTTQREILFAGHPTIGASTYLLVHNTSQNVPQALVPGAGPIPISPVSSKPGYVSAVIPHTYHHHVRQCSAPRILALHSTLSPFITENEAFPIVSIVHGMTFILIELQNLDALASAKLGNGTANILADSGVLDQGWEYHASIAVYMYVRNAEAEKDGVETIRTRMLVRGIEDPATGSAASALTGYLALKEADKEGQNRQWKIVQGVEMGRRSEIGVKVAVHGDGIDTIELSGTAVVVTEGTIRL
jgi:PhzF family phenazine biosynthesis protein